MRIVTTHLTRMARGYICVAGIEVESGYHVRPVVLGRMESDWSATNGGPFDIGEVVDLGNVQYVGLRPEIEDFRIKRDTVRSLGSIPGEAFWDLMTRVACEHLPDLFGHDIKPTGRTFAVPAGYGQTSLGVYRPPQSPSLTITQYGVLRCATEFDGRRCELPVTDLRFYTDDYDVDREKVEGAQSKLRQGVPVLLGVGLTRPWQKPDDDIERHWLQVNNLHFADDPLWRLNGKPTRLYSEPLPILDQTVSSGSALRQPSTNGARYAEWARRVERDSVARAGAGTSIWAWLRRLLPPY